MIDHKIEEECLYLYNLGNNDRHIALKLNKKFNTKFSVDNIRLWRRENNFPITGTYGNLPCKITDRISDKIILMLKDGKTIMDISLKLGISIGRIKSWMFKHKILARKLLNLNRKETIIKLFKESHSDKEISDIVGGTPRGIYQWRRKKGYL